MSTDILVPERDYSSLSVKDLLEARDHYHWHLTHMRNVVGTAIGLYFVRADDPWPSRKRSVRDMREAKTSTVKPPRTFVNSEIRDYSWPCVLVLVDAWMYEPDQAGAKKKQKLKPGDIVPKILYLPDGRTIPVCVIKVERTEPDRDLLPSWTWPRSTIGGGFPLISSTQGRDNIASVGTLVTDGHTNYALTSRHVAGPEGHPVSTILGGRRVRVGRSSGLQLSRLPFSQVYPEYPGRRTFATLDAGLIRVRRVDQWSSQIYGLPPSGELADLSELTIGTRLIDSQVLAYGAASGLLRGKVAALFYRHRSRGGYDDVTDFLIAPLKGSPSSQPGDSGTVWHLVQKDHDDLETPPRPLALQWGGQRFSGTSAADPSGYNFALAASLTSVLRLLDLELVVEHNTAAQPFWGKTGHYSIASMACQAVTTPALETLFATNIDRIGFALADLDPREIDTVTKEAKRAKAFIPLADVADLVWKNTARSVPGGRDPSPHIGPEHPVHYADIDVPGPDGRTLRELCLDDNRRVDVEYWQEFYDALGHTSSKERGLLPFRVWQFFDAMVDAVHDRDPTTYVCAAGLLAHYVGDACQPLHGSQYADGLGDPDKTGAGIHSAYETAMVDHRGTEVVAGITDALAAKVLPKPRQVRTGRGAATAVVRLMDRAAGRVDPETLVLAYAATQVGRTTKGPTSNRTVTTALWEQFGTGTVLNMTDGALTLAMIWDAAWNVGGGNDRTGWDLSAVDRAQLQALYEDTGFVESLDLDHIGAVLKHEYPD